MMIQCWAIRHKPSGNFLPQAHKKRMGGFTHDEPVPAIERLPRLFAKQHQARIALGWWLQGVSREHWCQSYYDGEPELELVTDKRSDRIAADMEVVPVTLTIEEISCVQS